MTLPLSIRLAARELRAGLAGFRIFLACLAIGVAAIAAVGSTRAAIEAGLQAEGASLLGGDAEIALSYRFASSDERGWMAEQADAVSEVIEFRSLAVVGDDRALTQVRGVDAAYPLVGEVSLQPDMPLASALAGNGAVMEQAMVDRLALRPGDSFVLGEKTFVLNAVLERAPDSVGDFGLGPRTLLRTAALDGSGLIAEGTLFTTKYRLDLPDGADLAAAEARARDAFAESGMQWTDAREGAPGLARFVDRLGAFLVLVSLSGLAVGGVGISAAIRAWLGRKTLSIAILRSLGASRATVMAVYALQVSAMTALGIAIGLLIGALLPLALAPVVERSLPLPVDQGLYPIPLMEAAFYGALTAAIFTLWPLSQTEAVRSAQLIRDAGTGLTGRPRWRFVALTLGLIVVLVSVAGWASGTWWLSVWTTAGIAAALALLALAASGVRVLSRRAARLARGRPALRLALSSVGGPRNEARSVILSLGLGLSVLAAIGQIDGTLRASVNEALPGIAPAYFFIDIQPDQIDDFRARVTADAGVNNVETAPMLRGIISRINGRPAAEVAGDHWVVDGDRGITYAARPDPDMTITQGTFWDEDYDGPPQISFAAEEAEEMGLALGDRLVVNVLGRDIEGEITSFREVDFSTFGIGFVLTMNPSALRGAPHSYIATVYADDAAEGRILRDVAGAYPNVTAIRVRDAIERVGGLLEGIADATRWAAAATLSVGILVLIGAAAAGEGARVFEAAVLKTLGAARGRILWSFALRAIIMGAAAGIVALLAGVLGGWAVARFIMEADYRILWGPAVGIVLGGIFATLAAGLAFAARPLSVRPARVLRARE